MDSDQRWQSGAGARKAEASLATVARWPLCEASSPCCLPQTGAYSAEGHPDMLVGRWARRGPRHEDHSEAKGSRAGWNKSGRLRREEYSLRNQFDNVSAVLARTQDDGSPSLMPLCSDHQAALAWPTHTQGIHRYHQALDIVPQKGISK